MTTGDTEETCGGLKEAQGRTGGGAGGGGGGNMKLSFTTLSTIAIQAGQSQIVASVLKSGSLVHLQLVQVHPGLCEIGSNQEENETLNQEQQQLMEKLKKHEEEVLSVVAKSRRTEQRKRRDEGMKKSRKQEEEDGLQKAMEASLSEGWALLLRLLHRRQEVLTLAAEFYCRALEFAVSIDRLEDLQIGPESDRRTVQLTYDSLRRDLLGKSLQVLTSSSVLLQKLRQLQRTEALQRRGGVLQEEEEEEEEEQESSRCSRGVALRLEELVETLQDRRRRADQAVRLQLQQEVHKKGRESRRAGSEDWSLTEEKIPEQTRQSGSTSDETRDLKSGLRLELKLETRETKDLQSGSTSDVRPGFSLGLKSGSRTEETKDLQSGSRSEDSGDLLSGFRLEVKSGSRSEETRNLKSESRSTESTDLKSDSRTEETKNVQPGSRSEESKDLQSGSNLDLKHGFSLGLKSGSRSEENKDLQSGSRSEDSGDLLSRFRLELKSESRSAESTDLKSNAKTEESKDLQTGSRSEETKDLQSRFKPGFRLELKSGSRSPETRNLQSESTSDVRPGSRSEETEDLQSGSRLDLKHGFSLGLKSGSRSEETKDLQTGSRSNVRPGSRSEETEDLQSRSRSEFKPGFRLELKSGSRSAETRNLQSGSRSNVRPGSRSEETEDLQSRSKSEDLKRGFSLGLKSGSRQEETRNLKSESRSTESTDLESDSRTEETKDLQTGSRSEESKDLQPGFKSDLQPAFRLDVRPGSRSEIKPGSRSEETKDLQSRFKPGFRLELKSGSRSPETRNLQSGSRSDVRPGSRSEENKDLQSGSKLDLKHGFRSGLKSGSRQEETKDLQTGSRSEETEDLQPGFKSDLQPAFRLDVRPGSKSEIKPGSRSEETGDLQSGSRSEETGALQSGSRSEETRALQSGSRSEETRALQSGSRSEETGDLQSGSRSEETGDLQSGSRSEETGDLQSGSRSEETGDLQSGSRSEETGDLQSGSRSEETGDLQSGSRSEAEHVSRWDRKQEVSRRSGQVAELQSMLGNEIQGGDGHAHQTLLTNQRQQLLSSCEQLVDKMWSWVQQGSSVLSNSSEAGGRLSDAEKTLNTHLQLRTQAESAGHDAESVKQILDQIRALHAGSGPRPPGEPGSQLSPLKALTEQLKRGGKQTRTGAAHRPPGPPAADPTASLSPELAARVDLVLKELQSLNMKIDSNLQLLQPYVSFLRTAQQVEEEMEELREVHIRSPEEEEEEEDEEEEEEDSGSGNIRTKPRSLVKQDCWQETLQKLLKAQELGNNYVNTVSTASGSGLNRQSAVTAVRQALQRLSRTKQEVNQLLSQQQVQIQQQQEFCRKYQERLRKAGLDLTCVSELLDSCTLVDLGSDLQTSRLMEHFRQARPHFTQLDAEVDYMEKSWETVRGAQETLAVKQLEVTAVKVEDLSELLELQKKVKNKIHQSESILDLTSSFQLTSQQLDVLLQSQSGSSEAELSRLREDRQQIQNLFKTASTLKTDICTAVNHSGWMCFRVEQLEARLLSLDSLCVSWLNEASRREDRLRRQLLTSRLNDDINQLRDSFKELKKRFSNLKFNYLKRNDRTRNTKAVRNQLQQVELFKEKLQLLRKRLQGVTARLGSEVKDGGVAREVEDAVNELQRQMGDFERSVNEHQKTLEMTRRLQQAMEEYQFWCEEASATIARVGKFSSECRSTEAVSVLYRQFEKFVWPTVPQQEERISQIAELAVRLHGVEEGRRYIEKTVSKHSEMVESIKELSDGLIKLEAKLKLESLKKHENDGEKKVEGETERRSENETEDKDGDDEKKLKENRKMKKKEQTDNRRSQEAADMYELKETGHTPELTAEDDGKEVPVKRQSAANRKPPLQKSRSQETDRQTDSRQQLSCERFTSSYSSTHTFSLSCSPVEASRRIHTINSQSQPVTATEPEATPHPAVIGPLFSDIQREFQRTEALQDASAGGLSEELQQQEVMTEDSLSNDEYECVSPDDISLPPLAETPESFMVQSDFEEGFCFSSHSVHISQYSHQYRAQSDHSGTGSGAVRQQRESSQTESCPTPPTSHHSSSRFRSGSSSFVQSPLTVPAPSHQVTSTLCSILRMTETSPANIRQSADPSPELNLPPASKDNKVPEKRSPSQSESSLKEQRRIGTQGRTTQSVASKGETLPQTEPIPQAPEFNHSPSILQTFNDGDPDLHKNMTPQRETAFTKSNTDCSPQSIPDSESGLHQDTPLVSKPESNCTVTQQTSYLQSSSSNSHGTLPPVSSSLSSTQESLLSQTETLPQLDPVSKVRKDKDRTQEPGFLKSCATCPQTSTAITKDSNLLQSCPDSQSDLDQDAPSSQTSKDSMSQSSRPTTATKIISISVSSRNLRSQQGSSSFPGNRGAPIPPEPNGSSSNRLGSKQSHQTVYSPHESLTSTCTQQCVHDPGMTPSNPAKPTAPSQPESQTQALAQQANLHVIPLSSSPHLLTPDQDPNICQPMAIREEIRLTPQIQGPPFPAPPPQAESLPQGKASKPGPPCFTRPLSRATVMEGSPVTLEVEVTEHPEPRLTWCNDEEMSATGPSRGLTGEDRKHFLFVPEASDSDTAAESRHDERLVAGNGCSSGDKWLVAEVFDIISADWQTWFGTLCVLLWLLYLIVL